MNEVVKDYLNRPISFVELLRAQDEITKLYIDNGYITTGAYIPPQTIADGFVQIEVLEGSLADISIAGLNHLSEDYIRDRLGRGTAVPVNVNNLVDSLQLLQLNPNIDNISAELTTGTTLGTSILDLDIKETKRFHSYAKFDNGRSPSVGTLRAQARLSRSSLWASGDELSLAYVKTEGSDTLDELAYRIPLNAEEGTLSFAIAIPITR
ncbi:MAG: ShlB/FhaC/HecB family hemolysin secretion/activation protein [Synechococcaceae cyanobacterium RL_1_2]|nr:ShlB/FhaC/HecB family hemolysin secretion/activation protein [Synechococcaceae cyanobacterium RL_1_2]